MKTNRRKTMARKTAILLLVCLMAFMTAACGGGAAAPAGDSSPDYEEIYDPVLRLMYDTIMCDPSTYEFDDGTMGIWESTNWLDVRIEALMSVGYTMKDLNGDDIPELFICATNAYDNESHEGRNILAMYTISDDEPQLVIEGTSRDAYALLGDGRIYNTVRAVPHMRFTVHTSFPKMGWSSSRSIITSPISIRKNLLRISRICSFTTIQQVSGARMVWMKKYPSSILLQTAKHSKI